MFVYLISLSYQPLLTGNKANEWYQKGVLLHFEPWLNYADGNPATAWGNGAQAFFYPPRREVAPDKPPPRPKSALPAQARSLQRRFQNPAHV